MKIGTQSKGFLEDPGAAERIFGILKEEGVDCLDLNLNLYLKNQEIYTGTLKGYRREKAPGHPAPGRESAVRPSEAAGQPAASRRMAARAGLVHILWGIKGRMMKAGLWPERLKVPDSVRQAAQKAERGGFFDRKEAELLRFFEPLKAAADRTELSFCQAHAPFPVFLPGKEDVTRYMKSEVLPKCISICGSLHIPYLVVHPWLTPEEPRRYEDVLGTLAALAPACRESGVMLCLENIYDMEGEQIVPGPGSDIREACDLIDRINQEAGAEICGFCLDTGHLKLTGGDLCDAICELGSRLKCLHINDNDGRQDLHLLPEGDGGEVARFAGQLCRSGYEGVLNFETFGSVRLYEDRRQAAAAVARAGRQLEQLENTDLIRASIE